MKSYKRYKFLNRQGRAIVSGSGDLRWRIGQWNTCDPDKLSLCEYGLHASKKVYEAFSYIQGNILAEVECRGKHLDDRDKQVWSEMRIVKCYKWTKKDSVALSIFAAELCLKEFEKLYPDDKRPRKAIDAARRVLEHDTAKNRSAAVSAAWSAESAAVSAAWSAEFAAKSTWSATWSAARSAAVSAAWSAARSIWSVAWSAESAAVSAAWSAESAATRKIDRWMTGRIKELEEIN